MKRKALCALCVSALLLTAGPAGAESARDIAAAAAQRDQPEASFQVVRMTLKGEKDERTRLFHMYQRKAKDGWDTRIELKEPADVAGTVLLTVEGQGQYLWLPRLKRVRRVAGKSRSGSFVGSDFAFEDMETRSVSSADYETAGEDTVGDLPCDRVVAKPHKDAQTSYTRIETCFSKSDRLPLEVRFFDADGQEAKVLTVDVASIQSEGSYKIPRKMTMKAASGHSTLLEITELDLEPDLKDSLFDPKSLDR